MPRTKLGIKIYANHEIHVSNFICNNATGLRDLFFFPKILIIT